MLDRAHLRDQVGEVDQLRCGIPPRDDYVLACWTPPENRENLLDVEPSERKAIGQLIQHDHVVGAALDGGPATVPSFMGQSAIALQIGAGPGEPATQGNDFNVHLARGPRLSPVAAFGLDELEHGNAQTLTPRPEEQAKCCRSFSFAVSGMDD